MIRWNLTGTPSQVAIAREAFNRIKFPFDRLSQLPGIPELGWRDLNGGYSLSILSDHSRAHEGHHVGEDKPHSLEGPHPNEPARRMVYGEIWIVSGRIYIEQQLEKYPMLAMETIGMEAFHAVDLFLPMTDAQRDELMSRWNKGGTWWEVSDYSTEYFRLGGEAWMYEGLGAYSDFDLGASPFMHDAGVEKEDVWRILGVRRTDYVAPPPQTATLVRYGTSTVYHRLTHYPTKTNGIPVTSTTGLRPCKVCKP